MISPFALFPPEGLNFKVPNDVYKKHAEFALFELPTMLEKHSSTKMSTNHDFHRTTSLRKHKRNSSIILPAVGILMNACKNVSFAPDVEENIFKHDKY